MTLPDERYLAVRRTSEFLQRLASGEVKRLPKSVRQEAYSLLRHYPTDWDMKQAAMASPHLFAEHMEAVTRLFLRYEQSRAEQNEPQLPDAPSNPD